MKKTDANRHDRCSAADEIMVTICRELLTPAEAMGLLATNLSHMIAEYSKTGEHENVLENTIASIRSWVPKYVKQMQECPETSRTEPDPEGEDEEGTVH